MRRRFFMQTMAVGALGAASGCATAVTRIDDGGPGPSDAAPPGHDAALVAVDAAPAIDASRATFVVRTAFSVLLSDTSCSGHDHECDVAPASYADDTPISFNGPGSHQVDFRPSELMMLEAGAMLPFATVGPGPGHGHCGMAWRTEIAPPTRMRVDACTTATPDGMTRAVCSLHPHA
jgi:hypothetical protein